MGDVLIDSKIGELEDLDIPITLLKFKKSILWILDQSRNSWRKGKIVSEDLSKTYI